MFRNLSLALAISLLLTPADADAGRRKRRHGSRRPAPAAFWCDAESRGLPLAEASAELAQACFARSGPERTAEFLEKLDDEAPPSFSPLEGGSIRLELGAWNDALHPANFLRHATAARVVLERDEERWRLRATMDGEPVVFDLEDFEDSWRAADLFAQTLHAVDPERAELPLRMLEARRRALELHAAALRDYRTAKTQGDLRRILGENF